MKTGRFYFNRLSAVKFLSLTVISVALLFLAGCIVTSVYPYYTDKDLVSEPALLGKWVDPEQTNSVEYIQIIQRGTNGYWLTDVETNKPECIEIHLFRLKQQLFLDTCPTNRDLDFVPVHQISKVTKLGQTLEMASLNYKWLSELIEKKPGTIRHIVVNEDPNDDSKKRIVLTDDTKNLQRFVLKYLNDTNAWGESSRLKKVE